MIGITSTVPQEVIWASGQKVLDLNNAFIQGNSSHYIDLAEKNGFPGNICAWIKGIYGVIKEQNIDQVIGITEGDCSTTRGLLEILENEGINIIPFSYPQDRDTNKLTAEIKKLQLLLGVNDEQLQQQFAKLNLIRNQLNLLDQIATMANIDSKHLYLWLLASSDFNSDPDKFAAELDQFINGLDRDQPENTSKKRIGYLGVPMIQPKLIDLIEEMNGRITYFEVPRQFSLIPTTNDLVAAYQRYTYPYHVKYRIADICEAVTQKKLQGLIHYTQSFCFRQIEDILFKKELDIPILTLELDRPGDIDNRTRLRIESFLESLD